MGPGVGGAPAPRTEVEHARESSALQRPGWAAPPAGRAGQRPLSAEVCSSPQRPTSAGSAREQPRVGGPVPGDAPAAGRVAAAVRFSGRRVGARDC